MVTHNNSEYEAFLHACQNMENGVAQLEHDIQALLLDLNNYGFCDPPTNCIRAGVLSYHRESDNPRLDITSADSEPSFECPSICEYCHRKAMPALDWRWEDELEAVPEFCCAQHKMLCMALLRKRPSVDEEEEGHGKPTDLTAALLNDREKRNAKNITDLSRGLIYPGDRLAVLFIVTKDKERICLVYDNNQNKPPQRAIRGIFQSNGMVTCYHTNGNIWLNLNSVGGQCLDETGARVRRWSWKTLPPPHLPPLFLSLNKNVGVRVLGKDQIFISFLANGQQARCSVGSCSAQCKCTKEMPTGGVSLLKDELFVLAARVKIHLSIQHLNWSLLTPLHQRSIRVFGKKLLDVSNNVLMSQRERAFIRGCLQECLE
ncbi:uncharacterized protein LOC144085949 [Stigmatopora argus]